MNSTDQVHPQMGWTALHQLVVGPDLLGIRILLEAGARTDIKDGKGRTPLDHLRERLQKRPDDAALLEAERVLVSAQASSPR